LFLQENKKTPVAGTYHGVLGGTLKQYKIDGH